MVAMWCSGMGGGTTLIPFAASSRCFFDCPSQMSRLALPIRPSTCSKCAFLIWFFSIHVGRNHGLYV